MYVRIGAVRLISFPFKPLCLSTEIYCRFSTLHCLQFRNFLYCLFSIKSSNQLYKEANIENDKFSQIKRRISHSSLITQRVKWYRCKSDMTLLRWRITLNYVYTDSLFPCVCWEYKIGRSLYSLYSLRGIQTKTLI